MTVYDYVKKGIFSKDGKTFKLTNTEKINKRWRGKAFSELNETDQKKIRQTTIHAIIFEQKHPIDNDSSLFQIFERINTSGKILKAQEIRNCVYQGDFNKLLLDLNKLSHWRVLFGAQTEDSRMSDIEFILRFFALGSEDIKHKKEVQISLKSYLNSFMGEKTNNSKEKISLMDNDFRNTIFFIHKHIGRNAFKNINSEGNYQTRFNPTIFDSISIATNFALKEKGQIINKNNLQERHLELLNNEKFKEFSMSRTTNLDHINGRINIASQVLYDLDYE